MLLGRYKTIIGDEWQDYSKSKIIFVLMLVLESDANGGPGWSTQISTTGDDDQSINGFAGAAAQAFNLVMVLAMKMGVLASKEEPDTALTILPKSLRCGFAISGYARQRYMLAWQTYASECTEQHDLVKPLMTSVDGAHEGLVEEGETLKSRPLEFARAAGNVIVCARRQVDTARRAAATFARGVLDELDSDPSRLFGTGRSASRSRH